MDHDVGHAARPVPTDVLVVGDRRAGRRDAARVAAVVVVEHAGPRRTTPMATMHARRSRVSADPPPPIVAAVEAFDPDRVAVVIGSVPERVAGPRSGARSSPTGGRSGWRSRTRPSSTRLLDRAGVDPGAGGRRARRRRPASRWRSSTRARAPCGPPSQQRIPRRRARHAVGHRRRRGGGDDRRARAVCDEVRVMPFLDGIATSVHGIVLPDGSSRCARSSW